MTRPAAREDQGVRREDRRRYRSALREERAGATRRAVVRAAHDLFATKGWSATGMREIAADAGVAIETVYSHFSSKRGVLQAVADAAVVGDDAQVPLALRPEFLAIGRGRRSARIAAASRVLAAVHLRTAHLAEVIRQAAPADDEIAEMLRETRERQRRDVERALGMILDRPPTPPERDGVWALASPEVYLLLVDESGWTAQQYEAWIVETFERIIPRS